MVMSDTDNLNWSEVADSLALAWERIPQADGAWEE